MAELFDRDREVIQVHLGGGTPNFLDGGQLQELMETLRSPFRFSRSPARDIPIELDPRFVSPADIASMADIGVNRVRFGVHPSDTAGQGADHPIQRVKETRPGLEACRPRGIRSLNISAKRPQRIDSVSKYT